MEGFIKRYDELPIKEIWLVDIEDGKEKLEIVGKMAQRMWDASLMMLSSSNIRSSRSIKRCRFRYNSI